MDGSVPDGASRPILCTLAVQAMVTGVTPVVAASLIATGRWVAPLLHTRFILYHSIAVNTLCCFIVWLWTYITAITLV